MSTIGAVPMKRVLVPAPQKYNFFFWKETEEGERQNPFETEIAQRRLRRLAITRLYEERNYVPATVKLRV